MVQGEKQCTGASRGVAQGARNPDSRKKGFEAVQRKDREAQEAKERAAKYGAWGSTFKSKEHFVDMHHC